MDVYIVTKEFSAPQLGVRLYVADTVGKVASRVDSLIGSIEYPDQAFYNWIATLDSLNYLAFIGTLPDPSSGGGGVVSGSELITISSSVVTVTGKAWGYVPTGIIAAVLKPTGGANMFATVRSTTISADGFVADISAPAPASGYVLVYIVMS